MAKKTVEVELDTLSLENAAGGEGEVHFQRFLDQFARIVREHCAKIDDNGIYAETDGCLKGVLDLKIELLFNVQNDVAEVGITSNVKLPGYRGARNAVRLRETNFFVEQDDSKRQLKLLASKHPQSNRQED